MSSRKFAINVVCAACLVACAGSAMAEEVIQEVSLVGQSPRAVVLYKTDTGYHLPESQAYELGLKNLVTKKLPGYPEPVVDGLTFNSLREGLLSLSAPAHYFGAYSLNYTSSVGTVKQLTALPFASVDYNLGIQEGTKHQRALVGNFSLKASLGTGVLESDHVLARSRGGSAVLRAGSRWISSAESYRLELGDVSVGAGVPLLTAKQALGFRWSKRLDAPSKNISFNSETTEPGKVSVLANGRVIYQAPAQPGIFSLDNLPRLPGEAQYQLVFQNGQTVRILGEIESFKPVSLIGKGAHSFDFSLGATRMSALIPGVIGESLTQALQENIPQYLDKLSASGLWRYGIGSRVDVEASALSAPGERYVGALLDFAVNSRIQLKAGVHKASGLLVRNSQQMNTAGYLFNLSGSAELGKAKLSLGHVQFTGQNGTPRDALLSQSRLNLNMPVGAGFVNAFAIQSKNLDLSLPNRSIRSVNTVGASWSQKLGTGTLNFIVSSSKDLGARRSHNVGVSWSIPLGKDTTASVSVGSRDRQISVYGANFPDQGATGYQYSASVQNVRAEQGPSFTSGYFSGQYLGQKATVGAIVSSTGSVTSGQLSAAGSLVVTRSDAGLQYQAVSASFSSAKLHIDVKGDALTLNAMEGAPVLMGSQRIGQLDAKGRAIVNIPAGSVLPVSIVSPVLEGKALKSDGFLIEAKSTRSYQLSFEVVDAGIEVALLGPSDEPIAEGTVVTADGDEYVASSQGTVWLEKPAKSLQWLKSCVAAGVTKTGIVKCGK